MFSFIIKQLNRLPKPWNLVAAGALFVLLIVTVLYFFGQIKSCGYDKARAEYQKKEDEWKVERTRLIASAEEKERRVAELEPKVQAYEAAAAAGKKLDESLIKKIDQIGVIAAHEESKALEPTDCRTRASRTCDLVAQTASPITATPSSPSASNQDSEILKLLEVSNLRLKAAEEMLKVKDDRIAAKDEIIAAKDGSIETLKEQITLLKSANVDRAGANTIDQFRVEACQTQLAKADSEIQRLRNPPFFKRLFSPETVMGFGFGYGARTLMK